MLHKHLNQFASPYLYQKVFAMLFRVCVSPTLVECPVEVAIVG